MILKILFHSIYIIFAISFVGGVFYLFKYRNVDHQKALLDRKLSYRDEFKFSFILAAVISIISGFIYYETKSIDITLALFFFFQACNLCGLMKGLVIIRGLKDEQDSLRKEIDNSES